MNKTWNKEEIKENLLTDDVWVVRGVVAIFNRQTAEEKEIENTVDHNGIGFNGVDGHIMSSFAKQIQTWNHRKTHPNPLSPKQMMIARKKIIKYSGQLTKIANGEI